MSSAIENILDPAGLVPKQYRPSELMSAPKVATPAVTPPPTAATPDVEAAARAEAARRKQAQGRASTMLTAPSQAQLTPANVGTKKLLGA